MRIQSAWLSARKVFSLFAIVIATLSAVLAEDGEGPFPKLVIRGAMLVDGSGAPPFGPTDIVIEGNRIVSVQRSGFRTKEDEASFASARVIDGEGMYVTPGFVDMHGHIRPGPPEEYIYKLWMAHGITTIRDIACHRGIEFCVTQRKLSQEHKVVAPRIFAYVHSNLDFAGPAFGYDWQGGRIINTPADAREYVRYVKSKGVDGLKSYGQAPEVLQALVDEAKKYKLGVGIHINQLWLPNLNSIKAAEIGVTTLEHWYGEPESLLEGASLYDYPPDYNYLNEVDRFSEWSRSWLSGAEPGSEKWNSVLTSLYETGVTIDPTLAISESMRDVVRAENKPWFGPYGHPTVTDKFKPNPHQHGGFLHEWTTEYEGVFSQAFSRWQKFLNDYNNMGGHVTLGTDSGVFYSLYGFSYIREMELLQHAGFNPLEVIRSATHYGAQAIAKPTGKAPEFGLVKPGYLADLVVVEGNPLENFKILYGTGVIQMDEETGEVNRVSAIKYTIKDGVVYDAKALLADVRKIVTDAEQSSSAE